jgi:pyruvate dehydrogenase E1 component alpha subunit
MRTERISEWGKGYGMPCQTVDGNDALAVLDAAQAAVRTVRQTGRPFLLETMTYRQRGHYSGDNEAHISDAEREPWLRQDPIARLQSRLLAGGQLTEQGLRAMQARAHDEIEAAAAMAHAAPYPDAAELLSDVYA